MKNKFKSFLLIGILTLSSFPVLAQETKNVPSEPLGKYNENVGTWWARGTSHIKSGKDGIITVTSTARTKSDGLGDIRDIDYIYARGRYYERKSTSGGWDFKWDLEDENKNSADAQIQKQIVFPDRYQRVIGDHIFKESGYRDIIFDTEYLI